MNVTDVVTNALVILSPLLLAGLSWLAARGAQLITAKMNNEYLRGVLVRLDDAVLAAVREVQQVTVDAIKTANADGKLTDDEKAKVKQAAIDAAKSYLGAKGLATIATVLGIDSAAVDKLLSTKVEAAVYDLKVARANTTGSTAGDALPSAA